MLELKDIVNQFQDATQVTDNVNTYIKQIIKF